MDKDTKKIFYTKFAAKIGRFQIQKNMQMQVFFDFYKTLVISSKPCFLQAGAKSGIQPVSFRFQYISEIQSVTIFFHFTKTPAFACIS